MGNINDLMEDDDEKKSSYVADISDDEIDPERAIQEKKERIREEQKKSRRRKKEIKKKKVSKKDRKKVRKRSKGSDDEDDEEVKAKFTSDDDADKPDPNESPEIRNMREELVFLRAELQKAQALLYSMPYEPRPDLIYPPGPPSYWNSRKPTSSEMTDVTQFSMMSAMEPHQRGQHLRPQGPRDQMPPDQMPPEEFTMGQGQLPFQYNYPPSLIESEPIKSSGGFHDDKEGRRQPKGKRAKRKSRKSSSKHRKPHRRHSIQEAAPESEPEQESVRSERRTRRRGSKSSTSHRERKKLPIKIRSSERL